MLILILTFTVSVTVTLLLVRSSRLHSGQPGFPLGAKPQNFHATPVPRIGGVAIVLGLLAGAGALRWVITPSDSIFAFRLLACALPVFAAGVAHDFTEGLTPRGRLLATGVSATVAFYVMHAAITNTAIPGLNWIVGFGLGSLLVTVFAVAGIANAMNIIDGFNGLASMCAVIMLSAIAYAAVQCADPLIETLALAGIGAVLGFFVWNFPAGLIFLGDGGAYFLGFFVAELSILLLERNPGEVSPLFPLLVCIYPIFETLFSIYRRSVLRSLPPTIPDGIHLHSLIYRRVLRWAVGSRGTKALTRRNSMTSPYLWLLCMLSVAPAVLFWNETVPLALFLVAFCVAYVVLYWRIVRFRAPRWLRFAPSRARIIAAVDNQET